MRSCFIFFLTLGLSGLCFGQAMLEVGAAVAGGSVGAAAGKQVSSGINKVLGRVEQVTASAARTQAFVPPPPSAGLVVGPGTPRRDSVPPPPALANTRRTASAQFTPRLVAAPEPVVEVAVAPRPLPISPRMTAHALAEVPQGLSREEVLKLGVPAARITMFDNGHLVELFSYRERDRTLGAIRISDGNVETVNVRQ